MMNSRNRDAANGRYGADPGSPPRATDRREGATPGASEAKAAGARKPAATRGGRLGGPTRSVAACGPTADRERPPAAADSTPSGNVRRPQSAHGTESVRHDSSGAGHDTGPSQRTASGDGSGTAGTHSGASAGGAGAAATGSVAAHAALEVRQVTVLLGGAAVLDDVSLTARAGEIVALLGPSGCGKTTLLRVIAGLQPHAGDVLWQGRSVAALAAHRRGFGLVFQDQALFPHLDVERNVAFGLRMQLRAQRGSAADHARRVAELLELVGLSGLSRRPVDALSGGEAQRVALARALAPHPRLLMLDEPLSGLDRPLRDQLLVDLPRILRRLRQTALFVTHDLEEALAVSDRVAVMRAGRIVQVGTPRALYERPASVFVARFLGRANILHGSVRAAGSVRAGPQADTGAAESTGSTAAGSIDGGAYRRLIETEVGPLPYEGPAGPGERGAVLIRPERISLSDTDLYPAGHPAAAGERAAGSTRAERIAPTKPDLPAGDRDRSARLPDHSRRHTLHGTLRDTSFRGIAALATVAVGGTALQVLVPAGRILPATGTAVTVSFDPLAALFPLAESC